MVQILKLLLNRDYEIDNLCGTCDMKSTLGAFNNDYLVHLPLSKIPSHSSKDNIGEQDPGRWWHEEVLEGCE